LQSLQNDEEKAIFGRRSQAKAKLVDSFMAW